MEIVLFLLRNNASSELSFIGMFQDIFHPVYILAALLGIFNRKTSHKAVYRRQE